MSAKPKATETALDAVSAERTRQHSLLAQGKFPDYWKEGVSDWERLTVLAEEFGEVSKEVCDEMHCAIRDWPGESPEMIATHKARVMKRLKGLIREELVQVAAVCVAWIESLDLELSK